MQRAGLIRATVVLGVLALFALTIGRVLAVIALISIIGIPIAFLLTVIPPLSFVFLLALGFTLFLERIGTPSIPVAFALAIGTMLAVPVVVNRVTERDVATFVAGDRAGPVEPWRLTPAMTALMGRRGQSAIAVMTPFPRTPIRMCVL